MPKKTKEEKTKENKKGKVQKIKEMLDKGIIDLNAIAVATDSSINTVRTQFSLWKKKQKKEEQ